jgi:hypothetical protein
MKLDFDKRYQVKGYPGIAWWIDRYPDKWEPYFALVEDEDGNEIEVESDEGEWIEDTECGEVLAVMVGDDKRHRIDIDDLIPLDDLDYCLECGQIGCTHDGRERP